MVIVLLGPPGAGKGTQARLLSESFNLVHIATGDMLRMAIKDNTEIGRQAKNFIEAGTLVPDDLVDRLVGERLKQLDCRHGFILDGYPRTLAQADTLQTLLEQENVPFLTIGIDVPETILMVRLGVRWMCPNCNRTFSEMLSFSTLKGLVCNRCEVSLVHRVDDTVDVVTARLRVYHERTEPLIRYYQERGLYVQIDGNQLPEKIFDAISSVVKERVGLKNFKT